MTEQEMDRRRLAEKRIICHSMACRAAQYFYQGDLPTAQSFFTVLKELVGEIKELEGSVHRFEARRASLLAPRKPWFERP